MLLPKSYFITTFFLVMVLSSYLKIVFYFYEKRKKVLFIDSLFASILFLLSPYFLYKSFKKSIKEELSKRLKEDLLLKKITEKDYKSKNERLNKYFKSFSFKILKNSLKTYLNLFYDIFDWTLTAVLDTREKREKKVLIIKAEKRKKALSSLKIEDEIKREIKKEIKEHKLYEMDMGEIGCKLALN